MENPNKIILFKIICFILLSVDIILATLFNVEYINDRCNNTFGQKIYYYSRNNNLTKYDEYLTNAFPCWQESSFFNKGIYIAVVVFLSVLYAISVIICCILFITLLYSKSKTQFIISIILYVCQIILSILSIILAFNDKNTLTDLIFVDFGELGEEMRKSYDNFFIRILVMKICSIYFLAASVFSIFSHLKIFINKSKKEDDLAEIDEGNISGFNDSQ